MQILYIFFGWVLGLSSSFALRWYDRKQKLGDFKRGIRAELELVLARLVGTRYVFQRYLGELDRESLNWFRSKCPKGQGLDQLIQLIEQQLSLEDDDLSSFLEHIMRKDSKNGLSVKTFHLPFLEANISRISLLDSELQNQIAKIRTRLHFINEEQERYLFYSQKTFDPKSMEKNADVLKTSIELSFKSTSTHCFLMANDIFSLLARLQKEKDYQLSVKIRGLLKKVISRLEANNLSRRTPK